MFIQQMLKKTNIFFIVFVGSCFTLLKTTAEKSDEK